MCSRAQGHKVNRIPCVQKCWPSVGQGAGHVDSCVAMKSFNTMMASPQPSSFMHCEDFDLLQGAWQIGDRVW